MKKLTIAIPTYNRKTNLEKSLLSLIDSIDRFQIQDRINILVIDNKSDQYSFNEIKLKYMNYDYIQIFQNSANIGASANFLRCIEYSETEYVWLLGDDENIISDNLITLLPMLYNADLYLIPRNTTYYHTINYYGVFCNIDDLLRDFYNMSSFFVLSTYIFRKESALQQIKTGYEYAGYQHPYSAIALKLLTFNKTIELLKVIVLGDDQSTLLRYDRTNAAVDVLYTAKNFLNRKQMKLFLKKDFYPQRYKSVFDFNLAITKPMSLQVRKENYQRLLVTLPFFSLGFLKSACWMLLVKIRANNTLFSILLFLLTRFHRNRFSGYNYIKIKSCMAENIISDFECRH